MLQWIEVLIVVPHIYLVEGTTRGYGQQIVNDWLMIFIREGDVPGGVEPQPVGKARIPHFFTILSRLAPV